MASLKLAAAALAVMVLVCAAAPTATAHRGYRRPKPKRVHEDCKTQAEYFKNCLRRDLHEACCGTRGKPSYVVADKKCFCAVEQEAMIECAQGRKCSKIEGKVKIASLNLSCLRDLYCKKHA